MKTDFETLLDMQRELKQREWQLAQVVHFMGLILSVTGPLNIDKRQAELFKPSGLEADFKISDDETSVEFHLVPTDGK